jgi:membrane protein
MALLRLIASFILAVIRRFSEHDGLQSTGNIAFSVLVGLFPFLVLLLTLAGFFGQEEAAHQFVRLTLQGLPADVERTLRPVVEQITTTRSGGLLAASLIAMLWIASSALESLRVAVNRAYRVQTPRRFWVRRLQSLLIVLFGAGIGIVVVMGLIALAWVGATQGEGQETGEPWGPFHSAAAGVVAFLGTAGLYQGLSRLRLGWRDVVPGAVAATLLGAAGVAFFSDYLRRVPDYSLVYGSLSGVIIVLFFFYYIALVFVLGAEVNGEFCERRKARQEPSGAEGSR